MPTEPSTVRVNFSRPFALFPLDGVVILPHALLRLFIFEPRYRQMVADALDSSGQIAMAVFKGDDWKHEYHGNPPIHPAVCVGQIVHHDKLPDGNYRIMLQGVCRARIREELPFGGESPSTGEDRLYRTAMLEPNETGDPDEDRLALARQSLLTMLTDDPLADLAAARSVVRESKEHEI
ncbi:MAG TPA: LON peptidase substrate-binding domain-containing protein, partial [Phycisphaerales bacterium]|nr:LON peptidase substrate-binding domain-containing protein [Phycisphaerales bacterium]